MEFRRLVRSRSFVRTTRTIVACLIAVLVCPAIGEVTALAFGSSVCGSAHACCRAKARGACPNGMHDSNDPMDGHCQRTACTMTCDGHADASLLPVTFIALDRPEAGHVTALAGASLSFRRPALRTSFIAIPQTPPPRRTPPRV
ncbi:MAG TPA: hypothetical protein VGL62_00680 [Vicinamibacterales bacterium]